MLVEKMKEKTATRIRKITCMLVAVFFWIIGFSLISVPFCAYQPIVGGVYAEYLNYLTPISVFGIMGGEFRVHNDIIFLGIVLFVAWILLVLALSVVLVKTGLGLFKEDEKVKKGARLSAIFATVGAGLYLVGSIVFGLVYRAIGGKTYWVESCYVPVVLAIVLDVLFAFFIGIFFPNEERVEAEEKSEEKKKEEGSKKRKLFWRKTELIICVTAVAACAIASFLTTILKVEFASYPEYNFSMSGIDILNTYETAQRSGKILAFLLFFAIVTVSVTYVLALVAYLGKSKTFFRFSIMALVVGCVFCFLVGIYGKYYQFIQSVNTEMIEGWLTNKFPTMEFETSMAEFYKDATITSDSFYFFLGAVGVGLVLLLRHPYTKGVTLEQELDGIPNGLTANIERSDLSIENGEGGANAAASASEAQEQEPKKAEDEEPCPAFGELDWMTGEFAAEYQKKLKNAFKEPTLPKLMEFIVRYARDSRLHLFYTPEDIATFIAGLGTSKLAILQGMSGTGKTSLPKIFTEAIMANCDIIEVESSWRDKNELLGYYNEFSKTYTPKKFTQALYKASLNAETPTFIVLDEMNLSRIEYYFSDFLSLMENEEDKREIKLLNVALFRTIEGNKYAYRSLQRGHTLKVLPNVWFIGTANRDESTFEISDKVYDRAHTMNFNKRAQKVRVHQEPVAPKFLSVEALNGLLEQAKKENEFHIESYPAIAKVEKILEPYNISFGNRIAMQIESFVAVYCACFTKTDEVIRDAVDRILLSKVVAKLELKNVEDKQSLAKEFQSLGFARCAEFVLKLNGD